MNQLSADAGEEVLPDHSEYVYRNVSFVYGDATEEFQKDVGDEGCQDVNLVGLGTPSQRPFHSQRTFEPLEEDFDAPSRTIEICDCSSREIESVGQEMVVFLFSGPVVDETGGHGHEGRTVTEYHGAIGLNAGLAVGPGNAALFRGSVDCADLGPGNEEGPGLSDSGKETVVVVGSIHDVGPTGLEKGGDRAAVVHVPGGKNESSGCRTGQIEEDVSLAGIDLLAIVSPLGRSHAMQEGGIKGGEALQTLPATGSLLGGSHEGAEEVPDDAEAPRAIVGIAKGGAFEAEASEAGLVLVDLQDPDDLAEGVHLSQVEVDAGQEVQDDRQLGKPASFLVLGDDISHHLVEGNEKLTEEGGGAQDVLEFPAVVGASRHGRSFCVGRISACRAFTYTSVAARRFSVCQHLSFPIDRFLPDAPSCTSAGAR
jgi:hypothetical protein